ncbi:MULTISPECIES: hypothetical protein [Afipia]|uniref:Uncharacterized protein n=2 Tax=Afipia felis TaxID=1035 RepID=A0A380WCU1_AFIFE|nr:MULTISPECIES: hypothetical protein [Afipia]EFI51373.1 conserved hypothetical protein [Afipia sp. 1NLS2]EKS29185.1 hypothetical protein HMPREF9697_01713 [Afipia felis ATCC 53690]SUU77892.1 Uncharacterised protein [Afipia felis]SUU85957.1 Uncharacterised protein [Afipia felis]
MKLNATQVKQTLNQMNAQVLPDNHPAVGKLSEVFGDHTFFVDEVGLKVFEPTGSMEAEAQAGSVVSLADWNDETFGSLKPHEPEPTGTVVALTQSEQ